MSKLVMSNLDFNNVSTISNLPDAVSAQQPATLNQLNIAVQGLQDKGTAVVATQANINLSAPGATIDGITMTVNDMFLARAQTAGAENGLYIYNGSAVAATRSNKMDVSSEFNNAIIFVAGGTSAGVTYRCSTLNPTVGTTSITFITFGTSVGAASTSAAGIIQLATQTQVNTGTDATLAVTPATLASYTGLLKKYSATFGDGTATTYTITHSLNSLDAHVAVYVVATGAEVMCDIVRSSVNAVQLSFSSAPATNTLRCVVID